MNNNTRTSQFLIGISNKQHKIVKFIDPNKDIKAQKIFLVDKKNSQYLNLIKCQLENIKDYMIRLNDFQSQAKLCTELEIYQSENNNQFVLKINTPFCQYPNLSDFYRKQSLNPGVKLKEDSAFYIYFFQQFFQLMVKGGGIKNFFYTSNNIFIIPPRQNSFLQNGKLMLNKTSIAGLKFLNWRAITKQEFIEIFPCLPHNVYTLMESQQAGSRQQLDLLIKIRSFAFLTLSFILKRIPILFDQNFQTMQDPTSQKLKRLIEASDRKMQLLLELVQDQIKKVEKMSKIKLREFFRKVFVERQHQSSLNWLYVHQTFFQNNLVNQVSFNKTYKNKYARENSTHLQNNVFFQKIIYQMWQMQPNKQFYIQRGFVELQKKKVNMVYFLVKANIGFHRFLRYINLIEFIKKQRFTEDANQAALKLMQLFGPKLVPKDEANPSQVYKHIQQSRNQLKKITPQQGIYGNSLTFQQQSDLNLFNPFAFKSEAELQTAAKTLPNHSQLSFPNEPIEFLQSIYTYPSRSNNEIQTVTTMTNKLQALLLMQRNLWPV